MNQTALRLARKLNLHLINLKVIFHEIDIANRLNMMSEEQKAAFVEYLQASKHDIQNTYKNLITKINQEITDLQNND